MKRQSLWLRCIFSGNLLIFILFPLILYPQSHHEFSLKEILEIGAANNPRFAAIVQRADAKRAALRQARSFTNPYVNYHIGDAENYEGTIARTTHELSIAQPIENPFKRHYRIQAFKSDWQAEEFYTHEFRLQIEYEIKELFFTILWLKKEKELAQENHQSIQEIFNLIAKKAELGEVKELEALKLEVETMQAENETARIEAELQSARENLNAYLGMVLPHDYLLVGELAYQPVSRTLEGLLTAAREKHPGLKRKEKEVEQAENLLHLNRWQRLPDFELSAFTAKDLHGQNKGLGLSFNIPLWNFNSAEIARSQRLLESHQQELTSTEIAVTTDIKNRYARLLLAEKTINLFQKGLLKQAGESERIARFSYQQGESSLIDYLDSQRTYLQIQKDYVQALLTWSLEKAGLEMAVGETIT